MVEVGKVKLTLPLNGVYFDEIKFGRKVEEYRLVTPFWIKRLQDREYDLIVLTRGYPKADDHSRRLVLPWRGCTVKTITHPHFGPDPVEVFAIDVYGDPGLSALSDLEGGSSGAERAGAGPDGPGASDSSRKSEGGAA